MKNSPIETERKYLIRMPDTAALAAMTGARVLLIRQTYLAAPAGVTERVRRTQEGETVRFTHTVKRRLSALSAYEDEETIDEARYEALLLRADPALRPIDKTRCAIPLNGFVYEIDVYPFWREQAILEIELPCEDVEPPVPEFVRVIADVSGDVRYKNVSLARQIPDIF